MLQYNKSRIFICLLLMCLPFIVQAESSFRLNSINISDKTLSYTLTNTSDIVPNSDISITAKLSSRIGTIIFDTQTVKFKQNEQHKRFVLPIEPIYPFLTHSTQLFVEVKNYHHNDDTKIVILKQPIVIEKSTDYFKLARVYIANLVNEIKSKDSDIQDWIEQTIIFILILIVTIWGIYSLLFYYCMKIKQIDADILISNIAEATNAEKYEKHEEIKDAYTFYFNENALLIKLSSCIVISTQYYKPQDIIQTANILQPFNDIVVILAFDNKLKKQIKNSFQQNQIYWALPNCKQIFNMQEHQADFVKLLVQSRHIPLDLLSPYKTRGGVSKSNLFFGRKREVSTIMQNDKHISYFLTGARQIGKSSLVHYICLNYQKNNEVKCIRFSLKDKRLFERLAIELDIPIDNIEMSTIKQALVTQTQTQHYLFIMDESDDFASEELKINNLKRIKLLKKLIDLTNKKCSFIFVGYWETYKLAKALKEDDELVDFADTILLKNLEFDASISMITEPIKCLGIRFQNKQVVDYLREQCGGRANLMAVVSKQLLSILHRQNSLATRKFYWKNLLNINSFVITRKEIEEALQSFEMREVLSSIVLKGIEQDVFDFCVRKNDFRFSRKEISIISAQRGYTEEEVNESLEKLEISYIIQEVSENKYEFCIPAYVRYKKRKKGVM